MKSIISESLCISIGNGIGVNTFSIHCKLRQAMWMSESVTVPLWPNFDSLIFSTCSEIINHSEKMSLSFNKHSRNFYSIYSTVQRNVEHFRSISRVFSSRFVPVVCKKGGKGEKKGREKRSWKRDRERKFLRRKKRTKKRKKEKEQLRNVKKFK